MCKVLCKSATTESAGMVFRLSASLRISGKIMCHCTFKHQGLKILLTVAGTCPK